MADKENTTTGNDTDKKIDQHDEPKDAVEDNTPEGNEIDKVQEQSDTRVLLEELRSQKDAEAKRKLEEFKNTFGFEDSRDSNDILAKASQDIDLVGPDEFYEYSDPEIDQDGRI